MEDKLVNKIFKGLIRFLIEVIVMTVLIVGINIFTNGMYLWGLPRINDIQSVNITYPSVTDDVKEISSSADIELALKLRSDLTSTHDVSKLRSNEKLGAENNQSRETVRRFIRLTYLVSQLLDMVDQKQISLNPAVELSYLNEEQQKAFIEAMDATQNAPSFSQAKKLRKLAEEGHLSSDSAYVIMNEVKKDELDKVVIKNDTLRKYFPENSTPREMQEQIVGLLEKNKSTQLVFANDALKKYFPKGYTPEQMENIVVRLLTQWQKKHQHSEER